MNHLNETNAQQIVTSCDLAKILRISHSKLVDYLREKEILNYFNQTEETYSNWFYNKIELFGRDRNLYITPEGICGILNEIKSDGIAKVTHRNPEKRYNSGSFIYWCALPTEQREAFQFFKPKNKVQNNMDKNIVQTELLNLKIK